VAGARKRAPVYMTSGSYCVSRTLFAQTLDRADDAGDREGARHQDRARRAVAIAAGDAIA